MPTLQYDIAVVGVQNVERAFASIERRFVEHNRRMVSAVGRTANTPILREASRTVGRTRRPQEEASGVARGFSEIAKAAKSQADEARRAAKENRGLADEARRAAKENRGLADSFKQIAKAGAAAERAQIRAAEAARREYRARTGTVLAAGGRSLAGIGKTALAVTGIGGGAIIASRLGPAAALEQRQRQLIVNARGLGEGNTVEYGALQQQITNTSIATGVGQEGITAALESYVQKTGDLETATANMQVFATTAMATGASVEDVASTAADLSQKFNIKNVEDMGNALAVLAVQGKRGAFELRDMASTFPEMAAAAQRAGFKGVGGMQLLGGLAQIARQSTGSGAEASTALQMALTQLVAKGADIESGAQLTGGKVKVFTDKTQQRVRTDFPNLLADVIANAGANGGSQPELGKLFDVRGVRAISPLIEAYNTAYEKGGGGAKGKTAGRAAVLQTIEDASQAGGSFSDVMRDAADVQKSANVQLEMLNTQLTAAVQRDLLPALVELAPDVVKLVPHFRSLVEMTASLLRSFEKNPIENIGHLIAAKIAMDIAGAAIGPKIKDALVGAVTGGGMGVGGSGAGGAGAGFLGGQSLLANALSAIVITTLAVETFKAGTLLVDAFMPTNKADVEKDIGRFNTEQGALANGSAGVKTLTDLRDQYSAELRAPFESKDPLLQFAQWMGSRPDAGPNGGVAGQALANEKAKHDAELQAAIDRLSKEIATLSRATQSTPPNRGNSPSPVKS